MSSDSGNVVAGVRGLLLKLHSSLSAEDKRCAALHCQDLIGDLRQECMLPQSENELALQASLLFSKKDGLLSFLRLALASDELRDARVDIISLLETVIQRLHPIVKGWDKTYTIDIWETCVIVYTKDKSAKSRAPALELLIKVLYLTKASGFTLGVNVKDLFNKFYSELSQKNRIPDTVIGKIYELLGVLGEVYPGEMVHNSDKLFRAYLGELKEQMTSLTKEPKLSVVAGCLRGITALMVNFTKSAEEDPSMSKEIFEYALKTISPQVEMNRYAVTFAGLRLLAKHAVQFNACLMDHYRSVFEVMSKLCGHINGEMKKSAYFALESFLKQVALLVAEDVVQHKSKLKFFMQNFCAVIKSMESTYKELSIAIRGYGYFAAPCKVVCPQDVDLMYTELIQRCKQMYLTESDGEEDNMYQLPSFLDSIASVLIHLEKIPEVYMPVLERLLVVQIDSYPQYSQRMQTVCCRSILKVLAAMASKGPVLWNCISSVVHQGLIRVCSKPLLLSQESDTRSDGDSAQSYILRTGKGKVPSCYDFLDLFKGLLDCDKLKESGLFDGAFDTQKINLTALSRRLYDEVLKSILRIVEKLDVTVHKVSVDDKGFTDEQISHFALVSSDPSANLSPNKPKDFTAFVNLVDFCSELLLNQQREYFTQWMYPMSHELIVLSIRSPLVSGYYKLLSVFMKIANRIKYFQGVGPKSLKSGNINTERISCFALFSRFGKEVCLRMKQYKDELMVSCLTFVLSLHHDIIALDIKAYVPVLQTSLKLGLSHIPLANSALDALETWSMHIPPEVIQPCYKNILPHLDGYLKMASVNDSDENSREMMSLGKRHHNQVKLRLLKQSKLLSVENETPVVMVRHRVVRLLGRLGGQLNRNLLTAISVEDMMRKFVSWDSEKRLSFAVPFVDIKPVIFLDPFLPRVTELALISSDRQTKVAACELLHSLVIYMVGKGSQMVEGERTASPMYNLHKRLFPVLLRLACDVDQITRQLFEPLMMQLIHWFTHSKKCDSQDTVAILEAILDGIVDPVESTLRDFCGRCIQEFVKWSIKQTTPEQQEKSPTNIKSLFKRIYSLALHPNGFKRLGAALAFNSIYRQFREENTLVDQFVFEALVIFVESLALAHSDNQSLGTVHQCGSAIDHLKKIIKPMATNLNQPSPKRRIPRYLSIDGKLCLSEMVQWLLDQSGRPQTECRHKCLELFFEFVPLLQENKSPTQWLEVQISRQGMDYLITKFEGGGLSSQPTLRDVCSPFSVKATLQWMDALLATMDCYNTFISSHMIKANHILGSNEKSNFFKAVNFFLTELAMQDLKAAESCFKTGQNTSLFSPQEMDQYNYSKCTIIVRLLEFAKMVIVKCDLEFLKQLEDDLLNSAFFELSASTVCQPSSVGFNVADVEVMKNLPEVCVPLLKAILGSPYKTSLEISLRRRISQQSLEELCAVDLYRADNLVSHEKIDDIVSACKQINKAGFLHAILHSQDPTYSKSLGSRLLMAVYKGLAPREEKEALPLMDITSRRLADGLVQLALSLIGQSEQIVELLLNSSMLSVQLSGSHRHSFHRFPHGEYFYSLFQMTINSKLLDNIDTIVPQLMEAAVQNPNMVSVLLNGMLDHSFRVRTVRKSHGSKLVEKILQRWRSLFPWWGEGTSTPESKTATLSLLSKLLQIDSSVCSNTTHSSFEDVFTTFTSLIVDSTMPLNLKSQALIMLPFFTTLPEEPMAKLQSCLENFVASHFPMHSDEFPKGSLHRNNYMDCVRKLLDALEISQSPTLLKLLAEILCRDPKHIMEDLFLTCFQKIARRSCTDRQMLLLCTVYKTIENGGVPVYTMHQAMLERVMLPLASHCNSMALRDFFTANISDIMNSLLARFSKVNEDTFEVQLLKKNGCLKLMELLYSRLSKDELYSKTSPINKAFCPSATAEGNELSKTLIKACFEAFTENMSGESQLLEIRRQYHCAAYNCAITVISCSFNEIKFYQGFLFTEKPEKNQFILENIVDVQRIYRFPIEVEVPLEKKRKYITIRKEVSEGNGEEPVYLSSQSYMADSSLREEMSQFDFSTGVQSFSYNEYHNPAGHTIRKNLDTLESDLSLDVSMDLEMDELNQHECMTTLTALIRHMQKNNITPKIEPGTELSDLPPWMKFLHGKLATSATPLNIRLFIAKLIINTEEIFRPYAKHWLGPLLQLVVSGNNGGEGIHYMVVDIVVTVLSWKGSTCPKGNAKDEILANRLLEFLMKNCFHPTRAVFMHNLEIIRTLVECWKDCLHVPYSLIYERFCGTDPNSKDNILGLQLLGIMLVNGFPAYDVACGIDYERYIQGLANNLIYTRYKEVYLTAAEIIGIILKTVSPSDNLPDTPSLLNIAASKLTDLKNRNLDDKFIICLSKLARHYPPFIDGFMNAVFFRLPKFHGVLKTYCLECVLSRADVIPEIFLQLKTKDFTQMIAHRDEARQRVCLDIIHTILPRLTPVELRELLEAVTAFIAHPSSACREKMYGILMWIHDNYSDASDSIADSTSTEILKVSMATLLQGLTDSNQGIQLYVRNFWSQEKRLPSTTLDRLLMLLSSLYSDQIEERFLSLATNLLLEMTSHSPDFTRDIFEYPLSDCKFQDYVIDSSWRLRSTVQTPMFVDTQASQSQDSSSPRAGSLKGQLRATQAPANFTQTQTSGYRATYNWMTGSSVDTLTDYPISSQSLSSSLMFGKNTEKKGPSWKPTGEGFGTRPEPTLSDEGDSRSKAEREQRTDILRLRRRFLKDQEQVRLGFAKKEISHQKRLKDTIADKKLKKEAQVTLYRSYRVGDLPDIQIKYSSLIATLQALAQRDPTVAKQLFSSLFAGILKERESRESAEEWRGIYENLQRDMNRFLSESTISFPPFVACLQEISYLHEKIQLQPAAISSSCLASLQQPLGILLLEKGLKQAGGFEEPPAKRSRGRKEIPPETEKWIHLAKLYRSVGDYDVVRGIFGGKVGTKTISCEALQAEANSDYAEAVKLYNQALNEDNWTDGDPTDVEKDFWEIAVLDGYSHLTEWKSLQYCATVNIDENSPVDLEKMWSDPFYQEAYLPYMVSSMVKQLQLGQRDQSLLTFVDNAMKVEERKMLMESNYSQELSLLYILQEDYNRAKYYSNSAMQLFMQHYSTVDTLSYRSRLTILQSVQALTEIQDFLQFITGEVSFKSMTKLTRLWTDRYPDTTMDPMNVWDDIITSRCFFLDKICEKVKGQALCDSMESEEPQQDMHTFVNNCKVKMKLRMAESAWKQRNFPVATKLLKELHRECKLQRDWHLLWVHNFSRFSHKRSLFQSPMEQINSMLKTIPLLDEVQSDCQTATHQVFRDQHVLLGTSYTILASAVIRSPSLLESIDNEKVERVLKLAGSSTSGNLKDLEAGLHQQALEQLYCAVKKADEELHSKILQDVDTSSIIESYMSLANFCDKLLREEEAIDIKIEIPKLLTLPVHVVKCTLKSLKFNSEEARLKFPRLLQIIELYPSETLDLMANEMLTVPCWLLIGWISQMVALLDKPEAVAVQHVITQMSESYPQVLLYPLMISSESYHFEESTAGHQQQEFVDSLKSALGVEGDVKDFVDALQQLTNPEMLFKDWWDDVRKELEKQAFDKKKIKCMCDEIHKHLGEKNAQSCGQFRKKFIQKFSKDVDQLLGPSGICLFEKRKVPSHLKQGDELLRSMQTFRRSHQAPGNLKEYSPWLSTFKGNTLKTELEIPGQYDGKSKPLPEYHAKIVGFDDKVKVMSSIRQPKRLTMRGDDEREYPFLVKGGEDLRQDQRIEQLFGVMNSLLGHDTNCAHSGIVLRTYQVVPITTRLGLIEWMGKTCTLKDLLSSTRTKQEQRTASSPNDEYDRWLSKMAPSKVQGIGRYAEMYKKASRTETVTNFLKIEQLVPGDLLRRAFVGMSTCPDAFLSLRSHFASSHALLCISHWILGIGDRHLSNFMINMETGGMIGIDFGHAFGSATQFLPVPELMPFRLTRQFLMLMQPMKESGLIQSVMVHSLRAYRMNPDLLLNTMDVFVKEPSLDWKNLQLKQLKKGGSWTERTNTKEINWYPLQKVNFSRRKLEGANPATITSEELKLGFEKDPAFDGMLKVVLGNEEHNLRARLAPKGLSVENQVACLLDHAMDQNVLGRVWSGWEPWV